ncbi:hypothetical protein LguiA_036717 [Lonicera macranthoides]
MMGYLNPLVNLWVLIVLMAISSPPICLGFTDPRDVSAVNSLYVALGSPPLIGWIPNGGDPCTEGWQGVLCVNANITGIVLNGVNLGGSLGENLGLFPSIIQMDLSNNHIGGTIPSILPITMRSFYLSGNQLTGSIPVTLSSLGQLTDLSLNNNHLIGVVPDAFQQFTGLVNLDLSGNGLSGQLPPSMGNLLSLNTLHLQDNLLTGTLDILQDLPLRDLNIENNLFSGPIPPKLLGIPNFRRAGNPFNTTVIPSPPASPPSLSPFGAPPPQVVPGKQPIGPSTPSIAITSSRGQKFMTTKRLMWFSIAGLLIFIALALALWLFMSKCCKRKPETNKIAKMQLGAFNTPKENPSHNEPLVKPRNHLETVPREAVVRPLVGGGNFHRRNKSISKTETELEKDFKRTITVSKNEDHEIDMTGFDLNFQPPPPPIFPTERVIAKPVVPTKRHITGDVDSASSFTIASLQQYTNSFSQENLIGEGMLGTIYRAELPNGKVLAVKKLDLAASRKQTEEDFLELVFNLSKIRHTNIVEFVGYCAEHGQRLLVYQYCRNGTLDEALHLEDEIHKKLSWNARIRLALQAAKALEYLHEVCQPPVVHKNFKSANILLDEELTVRVSDCGLAPLISSNYMTQLQGYGYGGPELELGSYTYQSDVYSFGVVMLELITGRKSYDRSRPRGEQFLVRWAIPQLHDIDALSRMVDPTLHGTYPSKSLSRFADIISSCLQAEPEFRPPMSEIVQNLLHMVQREP